MDNERAAHQDIRPLRLLVLNIMPNDKDYPVKACSNRIMNAIVYDNMPSIINRFKLLDSATKAGTNTRRKNNHSSFHEMYPH